MTDNRKVIRPSPSHKTLETEIQNLGGHALPKSQSCALVSRIAEANCD
ncbi:hypothetical protein NC651_005790 [Populus alba x Populus x berolinensis]|nr:hypothetical protein NC651_005790 [Populus alba x Populus x berolinensis]